MTPTPTTRAARGPGERHGDDDQAAAASAVAASVPAGNSRWRAQLWLAQHLWRLTGVDITAGVTDTVERQRRLCRLLAQKGLADQVIGRFNGKPESYRQFCRRALGLEIDAPQEGLF
jgi:hypothetical protein